MTLAPYGYGLPVRLAMVVFGAVVIALGSGMYLASDLGLGPRDRLMTDLHRRLGWSIGRVRAWIELLVLLTGWVLGGTIGIGTVFYA
jgi:uncharacterized membrane protein YczE